MILLDTNIISELMQPQPNEQVRKWLRNQNMETLYISTISMAEVRFGIAILPNGKKKELLSQTFEQKILPYFADRVLNFDKKASEFFAKFKAEAQKKGLAVANTDGFIASIAHSNKLTVATRDTSPFEAMGLKVINPFD